MPRLKQPFFFFVLRGCIGGCPPTSVGWVFPETGLEGGLAVVVTCFLRGVMIVG